MSPTNEIQFISRYIMLEQKKAEDFGITEDDVSEIRQDINKFRFELLDILGKNKFDIGKIRSVGGCYGGKRAKQMERRIMNGFTLEIYDLLKDSLDKQDKNKSVDIFQVMAEAMHKSKNNQQPVTSLGSDYSPATVVAANKFKRFLGKHLKSHGHGGHGGHGGTNNNVQYGSITAPCSPMVKTREIGAESSEQSIGSEGETEGQGEREFRSGGDRQRENGGSLSCSKLTKINNKKSGNITGGWI